MQRNNATKKIMSHRSIRNQLLLRNHTDFEKECRVFLQKKEGRQAKCGMQKVSKKEMEVGAVSLQVLVGSTFPFNTDHVVLQAMYFYGNGHYI